MIDGETSGRPQLEVSDHYKGTAGIHYFNMRQKDQSLIGHMLEFQYFKPFLKSTDCVLDFGCGTGGMLRLMEQYVRRVVGIEVNASAAGIARSSGLTVYSSLETLPDDELYDVVVSNHVLEHIRNVPSTLEHIRERIISGGLVLLKVPMEDWRSADSRRWSSDDIDHHLQTWTPN
jgi:2-polyprenyl-3-methyl-5-hydroxy-6-metoxy-1,4-benzoquinol methylase